MRLFVVALAAFALASFGAAPGRAAPIEQGEPAPATPTQEESVPTTGKESAPASSEDAPKEASDQQQDADTTNDAGVVDAAPEGSGPLGKLAPPETTARETSGDVVAPRGGVLSDYLDTRLSFSFSDDNWLAGPGETSPSSPGADFFPRSANRFFFDSLNRRDTGYETLTHLVLYRRQSGFIPGFDTEAALVARFQLLTNDQTGRLGTLFQDDGSYVRIRYFFNGRTDDEKAANVDLVMFPFTTERFRLGYLFDVSWGGGEIFPSRGVAAPGAKLQFSMSDGYAYIGAKTARLLDENINEIESYWGVLSGVGWDFFDVFQIDAGGGFFNRGTNPLAGVEGQPVQGFGGSTRVTLHLGRDVPSSIDFRLYRQDPALTDLFRVSSSSKSGTSFLVSAEYSLLGQTLQDTTNAQTTTIQPAMAGALSTKLQVNDWAVGADAIYRDLAFILFNRPSFVPFQAFPKDAVIGPEFLLALSTSYYLEFLHLTPGMVMGFQAPATFVGLDSGALGSAAPPDLSDKQVVVVRNIGNVDILPCNQRNGASQCTRARQAEPIYALRLALKWDVSDMLAIVGESTMLVDNNEALLEDAGNGIVERKQRNNFDPGIPILPLTSNPYNVQLAAGVFAQARF